VHDAEFNNLRPVEVYDVESRWARDDDYFVALVNERPGAWVLDLGCGTSARQGHEREFHVIVGSDITATDDSDTQDVELRVLRKSFARVMTAAEICGVLASPKPVGGCT
jgi:hypothetical protein